MQTAVWDRDGFLRPKRHFLKPDRKIPQSVTASRNWNCKFPKPNGLPQPKRKLLRRKRHFSETNGIRKLKRHSKSGSKNIPQRDHLVMNLGRSIIIAELWRLKSQDVEKNIFFAFLEKRPGPYEEIFKMMFRIFSSRHRSICCVQILWIAKFSRRYLACFIYLTKNLPDSPALATAWIAPKIWQDLLTVYWVL